jgi:disulfide bond formation protein DsbB
MIEAAPVVRCDVVAWSLFGISMAGYNVMLSLALAAFAFVSAFRRARAR